MKNKLAYFVILILCGETLVLSFYNRKYKAIIKHQSFYLNSFAFNSLYYQNMLLKDSLGRRVYLFDAYDKRNTLPNLLLSHGILL